MVNVTYEYLRDFWPPRPQYLPKDYPDLTGKTTLVTGSNTGIGYETAKALLKQNATVVFANRSIEKTQIAVEKIKAELGGADISDRVVIVKTDLSDLSTIKASAEELNSKGINKLHYTILNAGVMQPPVGSKTKQGFELQIGTNVLGHQLLQKFLTPLVLNAVTPDFNPRVIWVASAAHLSSPANGGIDWDSFRNAQNTKSIAVYGQSKTGNIYQAYIYGQQHKDVISLAVHPGYLGSDLGRSHPAFVRFIFRCIMATPVYGSYSELFGALSPDVKLQDTGRYIGPWGNFRELREDIHDGLTNGTAQKLWDWAEAEIAPYAK